MQDRPSAPPDVATRSLRENWLFARLPEWVIDTLSTEQKEAIHQAAVDPTWKHPPINIRLSVPFIGRRYFLTVVGGEGKRGAKRRARERHNYPLRTAANIFFFLGLATVFYIAALVAVALYSAIFEF